MSKFALKTCRDLGQWFERQKRVLPWRDSPDVYRVWVSEIMLQQTQVVTVIPFFERFVARFPDVASLARASEEEVLRHWAGLGYYSRARNLHRAARQIEAAGRFPRDRMEWEEIPGVGPYTAGAILSISGDAPEAILDGNVERVLSRLCRVDRAGGDAEYKARLWELSALFVQRALAADVRPSVTNQALMELGAMICAPKNPRCELCPLSASCEAREGGVQEKFPPPKKRKEWIEIREKLHCVFADSALERVLLRKRSDGEWRAGLWDLLEDIPTAKLSKLGEIETRHVVTRHKISRLTQVWVAKSEPRWRAADRDGLESEPRWISAVEPEVPVGSALVKTLSRIRERFAAG